MTIKTYLPCYWIQWIILNSLSSSAVWWSCFHGYFALLGVFHNVPSRVPQLPGWEQTLSNAGSSGRLGFVRNGDNKNWFLFLPASFMMLSTPPVFQPSSSEGAPTPFLPSRFQLVRGQVVNLVPWYEEPHQDSWSIASHFHWCQKYLRINRFHHHPTLPQFSGIEDGNNLSRWKGLMFHACVGLVEAVEGDGCVSLPFFSVSEYMIHQACQGEHRSGEKWLYFPQASPSLVEIRILGTWLNKTELYGARWTGQRESKPQWAHVGQCSSCSLKALVSLCW